MPANEIWVDATKREVAHDNEVWVMRRFKWPNGWYFWRNEDGSVSFENRVQNRNGDLLTCCHATIPADEWVEVVKGMAAPDEAAEEG